MTCADDDNRIVLQPIDQHESDYVNASYVDVSTHPLAYALTVYNFSSLFITQGHTTPKKFIATQGVAVI